MGVSKHGCGGAFKYVIRKSNEKHEVIKWFFFPEKIIQWDVILAFFNRVGSDYFYNYRENEV